MRYFIILLVGILWGLNSAAGFAADLTFSPASPVVEVDKEITLSVAGTTGYVDWSALKGNILNSGTEVVYRAPLEKPSTGFDVVTVSDAAGNIGTLKIQIVAKSDFSAENAVWEVFTNRSSIQALLLSDDGKTLWVGTTGGLEEWSTTTGRLQSILLSADDLPSSSIMSILNDGQNGLWISTSGHYNFTSGELVGVSLIHRNEQGKLTIYTVKESDFLSNDINTFISDGKSGLWIGTNLGLAHFSQSQWTIYNSENSDLPSDTVNTILSDGHGGIWIGTSENYDGDTYKYIGGGLAHLSSQGIWTVYNQENSELPSNNVKVLHRDEQGDLWVVTSSDVGYFFALAQFSRHGLWTIYDTENSGLSSDEVNVLVSDSQGGLWLGAEEGGLIYRDFNGDWTVYTAENSSLPSNKINVILSDNQGGLWIGTSGNDYLNIDKYIEGSLAYLNHQGEWTVFPSNSRLPDNSVNALYSDNQGNLWIGSEGGLAHRSNQDKWTVYTRENSELPSNYVKVLLSDEENGLWIGCKSELLLSDEWEWYRIGGGLAHRNEQNQWIVLTTDNSDLPSNNINALIHDGYGGLWIGTSGGLSHYNGQNRWQIFDKENSELPDDEVTTLLTDGQDGIWIGTSSGLAHYDGQNQWQVFNTKNSSLPSNYVNVLYDDEQDRVWIGTTDGLARYDAENGWQIFNQENSGLPNNEVSVIVGDGQGGLWIGTLEFYDYDINKYVGGSLAHLSSQGVWTVYNRGDKIYSKQGLRDLVVPPPPPPPPPSPPIPPTWVNVLVKDGQNGLWIGASSRGLAHLTFPEKQKGNRAAIIIASGGNHSENSLWDATESTINYIYKMLAGRKFVNEEIYYVSSKDWADFNGDSFNDRVVDAPRPERPLVIDDIRQAFEWAKTRGKLDQPLYVFFMDHGGTEKLFLNTDKTDYMQSTDLKALLDDYQATTGSQVVLVIEACYSGSHLPILAAPNRAIITSAKADEQAAFEGKQGFTRFLIYYLSTGSNFEESYKLAQLDQSKLLSQRYNAETTQSAQLDDNGDGAYDPAQDGQWLKQVRINGDLQMADFTLVENLTTATTVTVGQPLPLKAKVVTAKDDVKFVWAVIRPPRMNRVIDTNGTPILAFPRENLYSTAEKDIYQATWNNAVYNGDYEITFYVEDKQGNITGSETSVTMTVSGGVEPPPQAQVQIHLGKDRYQHGETFKATLTEDLSYGYDLYIGVQLPDGQILTMKDRNQFAPLNPPAKWWSGRARSQHAPLTIVDLPLPQELPTGHYCFYGVLSPKDNDVFQAKSQGLWVIGQRCFEVE